MPGAFSVEGDSFLAGSVHRKHSIAVRLLFQTRRLRPPTKLGLVTLTQSDVARWVIGPASVTDQDSGGGADTPEKRHREREGGKTVSERQGETARGRKTKALWRSSEFLDFSQKCCPVYASHWLEQSQTCLCADVGELWEHVFFYSGLCDVEFCCWRVIYSNAFDVFNDVKKVKTYT